MHKLKIRDIFISIQGEGPFTGFPAVFIRLAGCNLRCSFCDEQHTEPFTSLTTFEIIRKILEVVRVSKQKPELIVITGGEPFLQNFAELVKTIHNRVDMNFLIHIETNGTIFSKKHDYPYALMTIIASPKRGHMVKAELFPWINCFKFIKKEGDSFIPSLYKQKPIWIQPMDEGDVTKNNLNRAWAVHLCIENNFKLSLQIHKIINIK